MEISFVTEQGSLTIVRRSSGKKSNRSSPQSPTEAIGNESMATASTASIPTCAGDDTIDTVVDLSTDNLPAVDTPDACDKAALRLVHIPLKFTYFLLDH